MRKTNYIYLLVVFLIFISTSINAQTSHVKGFFKLPRPEKCWVVLHPFKAKKAFKISNKTKQKTDSIKSADLLDGNANGGQVDAFRHAYWMVLLSSKIGVKPAYKLGVAHEKGNYIYYKKNKSEDGSIPDKISSTMDLRNNDIGINIYINNEGKSKKELEQIIVQQIVDGKLFIIKKNEKGEYLNCEGKVILQEDLRGKWENNKCLVFSNGATIY